MKYREEEPQGSLDEAIMEWGDLSTEWINKSLGDLSTESLSGGRVFQSWVWDGDCETNDQWQPEEGSTDKRGHQMGQRQN